MPRNALSIMLLGSLLCGIIAGCGPSKEDLMMRAAKRVRPDADQEPAEKQPATPAKAPPKKNPAAVATNEPPPSARVQTKQEEQQDKEKAKQDDKPEEVLVSIEERKPEEELSDVDRRKWAHESLVAIGEAMQAYHDKHDAFPSRYHKTSSGLSTLSWRVRLLPYMGHIKLYKKFDFNKPWYMEPNKSLLKYIPKEYVSPERFDTKTNWQLPAFRTFMFGTDRAVLDGRVEDGLENTIMLVEVDDHAAVEWTAPEDWEPDMMKLDQDIGSLRGDGTFAMWANGWPVLLPNSASLTQLQRAFTSESGDAPVVGEIHRQITIEGMDDGSTVAMEDTSEPDDVVKADEPPEQAPAPEILAERDEKPIAAEIQKAAEQLRTVYSLDISNATTDKRKMELGEKMLQAAGTMKDDPADAYALLIGASNLAIECGSASLLVQATDHRVGRFEVDAYEANMAALIDFSEGTVRRSPEIIEGPEEYVRRALIVIYAAITENDFLRAGKVARMSSRLVSSDSTTNIPKLFNRLRAQLGGAKIAFDEAKESLVAYRIDPENDAAAATFGQFLCFFKGDWETGLPLLARTSNKDLAAVAQMDLDGANDTSQQVVLGDSWWKLSRRAAGVYRQAAQDRAVLWYKQAYERMPESLDRMHVKNRLLEAGDDEPSSPIALCKELARKVNADLGVSLGALAISNYEAMASGKTGINYDDEDD